MLDNMDVQLFGSCNFVQKNWEEYYVASKDIGPEVKKLGIIPDQMLYTNLPDGYPSKREWMRKGFPELMELSGVKRICGELLPKMPQMTLPAVIPEICTKKSITSRL